MTKTAELRLVAKGNPRGGYEVPLVEYKGLLPRQSAWFLEQLSEWDRRFVYTILGMFEEVRTLVENGRLLHQFLKEGPQSAAKGRLTFQEFMEEKEGIEKDIFALRRRINGAVEKAGLRLPRVPQLKENRDGKEPHRRVS